MEDSRSALQKLEDLGPQFSAQVRKIRKALYQLTLDHPSRFVGWLRKFHARLSDISSAIGCEVEDGDNLSPLKLSLRPNYNWLRQHIQSHPDTTFQEAFKMLCSKCIDSKEREIQSNSLFVRSDQKICHECSSEKSFSSKLSSQVDIGETFLQIL